jgi:prepilin-type N-terminal cleavage/methylation domain-containing protein
MFRHIRDIQARRRGEELEFEKGFTLIELLIVIVVLGILAATVIFALTGVTNESAQAACASDAKTYEVAAAAYENAPQNQPNTIPTTTAALLAGINGSGPFLHQAASSAHYIVAMSGDPASVLGAASLPATPVAGHVYVGPNAAGVLVDFDSETGANGCNSTNL